MELSVGEIRKRLGEAIGRGDRAQEELEVVREDLERGADLAVRAIRKCVQKGSSDRKLLVAACRLDALYAVAEDLVGGIGNAQIARQKAQELMNEGGE